MNKFVKFTGMGDRVALQVRSVPKNLAANVANEFHLRATLRIVVTDQVRLLRVPLWAFRAGESLFAWKVQTSLVTMNENKFVAVLLE